jgi:hypothetical protein
LSIATVTTLLASLTFPALSVTDCEVEDTDPPSADRVWSAGHDAAGTPLRLSLQVKCTTTSLVYQPLLPFGDVVATAEIVGLVASYFHDVPVAVRSPAPFVQPPEAEPNAVSLFTVSDVPVPGEGPYGMPQLQGFGMSEGGLSMFRRASVPGSRRHRGRRRCGRRTRSR